MFEVCTDVPRQRWEARVPIFDLVADAVADAVAEQIGYEPFYDARLTGCDRRTRRPDADMGAHLCYVAQQPPEGAIRAPQTESPDLLLLHGSSPGATNTAPHLLRRDRLDSARRVAAERWLSTSGGRR